MKFRQAIYSDTRGIMTIIKQAQDYFKKEKINQWQNNYPNLETIKNDIGHGYAYVLLKNHCIVGTVAIIFEEEKTYHKIYNGHWLSNGPYVVIRRIAVDLDYKGLGLSSVILKNVEAMCKQRGIHSIKIDTHQENLPMRRFLEKNDFQYCGIIYLENGDERMAFERLF